MNSAWIQSWSAFLPKGAVVMSRRPTSSDETETPSKQASLNQPLLLLDPNDQTNQEDWELLEKMLKAIQLSRSDFEICENPYEWDEAEFSKYELVLAFGHANETKLPLSCISFGVSHPKAIRKDPKLKRSTWERLQAFDRELRRRKGEE